MSQKLGIFCKFKITNLIHHFFFSLIFLLACAANANAAGYSCPTYKKYTSCSSGYYLNGTGAGNSCASCPAGCTCAGGTAAPVCCTSDCTYNSTRSVGCSAANAASASGTQTCNATKNGVSGCYTWGGTTGCVATSCNSGYYYSGGACYACTGISFTDSGTDTGTDTSGCTATSQTITVSIANGSYKQNQVRSGSRSWSRPKSRTCYRTGGAGGTYGSGYCSGTGNCGAYSYGTTSYGSCSYSGWSNSGGGYGYSCNAGTYWNGSGCVACEAGYYCPGFSNVNSPSAGYGRNSCTNKPSNSSYTGSATSNACPWSCNAGYYGSSAAGHSSCANCGSGNYCTGGTHRATCASTVPAGSPAPGNIISLSNGSWSDYEHGASANDCICDWYFSDETRIQYMNETTCSNGPAGNNYTYYEWCRTGYYAADPLNFNNWYNSCKACTNAPANATYTGYSTPSTMYAVESNCPWQCNANHYKNGNACTACNSGYSAPAGSTAASACTKSCTRACTQQSCPTNAYSCTHGTSSTSGTDAQGVGCNAAASTCSLTINSCKAGNYKDGNACKACPSSHPSSADGTTGGIGSCYKSCTRACTQQACPANATCTHGTTSTSGTEYYGGSCSASTSTCTITVTCNPGYYKNSNGTCTACENGYYCTGNNARTACTTLGAGYTASDGDRTAAGNCYQSCSKACTQQACPTNAYGCTHGNTSTSGTQHYGGTCTAAASTCSLTVNSCKSGNYKNGNACTACPSSHPNSANENTGGAGTCYVSCGDISITNGTDKPVSATVYNPGECTYTRECNDGYNLTSGNICAALCTTGITSLKSGSGVVVPLYAARQTTHTINVGAGANVCYGSLASGAGTDAINVNIGGTTYHTVH